MFKSKVLNQAGLPLIIEPDFNRRSIQASEALISLYLENKECLDNKLLEHGGLLFRGFSIVSASAFEQFVRAAADGELFAYIYGTSPRTKLKSGIYTSTEFPPEYSISLHSELSYSHRWPSRVFFCCITAPQQGGETPLADNRALLNSIPPDVVEEFRDKGVQYIRNLNNAGRGIGQSWQSVFETADKSVVERYCREGGIEYKWKGNGGLWLSQIRPAIATHPLTRESVWFNQAVHFHPSGFDDKTRSALLSLVREEELPYYTSYGDGAPFDASKLEKIRDAMGNQMILFPWKAGDVLILDNMLVAHGRMPFKGARKILVAIS
ncbi:MAG: TauD/TfdA family dioxygenase [Acidobacteria bacterium]|nr:TauD/TfdA family dioxygenase [Acidobacteriota bacterium]